MVFGQYGCGTRIPEPLPRPVLFGALARFALLAILASMGCGEDEAAPAVPAAPGTSSGRTYTPGPFGGSTPDEDDAGLDQDAAAEDASGPANALLPRIDSEDRFEMDIAGVVGFVDHRGFAVAAGAAEFALAYEHKDSALDCTTIDWVRIPAADDFAEPQTVVHADGATCSSPRHPAITARDNSWHLAWVDERFGQTDLYAMRLDSDDEPRSITSDERQERNPVLLDVGADVLCAWIAEETSGGSLSVSTRLLGSEGNLLSTVVPASTGREPQDLVLAGANAQTPVLGWVDRSEASPGIFVQPLSSDGTAEANPEPLLLDATHVHPKSSVDIALSTNASAVVYSISIGGVEQVHFQELNALGQPLAASTRKIAAPPKGEARDASVAVWGHADAHQFVVAYRALSAPDISSPMIRLVTVDLGKIWEPDNLQPLNVAPAARDGGRTSVEVASDGTILVVWLDVVTSRDKVLRAVRVRARP